MAKIRAGIPLIPAPEAKLQITCASPKAEGDTVVIMVEFCPVKITRLSTVRTGNITKVRFSATVGEEPEVEVALV